MSEGAAAEPKAAVAEPASWEIRVAGVGDVPAAAAAVGELLVELGGESPSPAELEEATRALVEDPDRGALLLALAEERIVGLLAASWQLAIHVPGRYGTIQDLWVDPKWRSRAIGHDLVEALAELAGKEGVGRLEVGLPKESFAAIRATESFYLGNGFVPLGPRMRRLLK